MKYNISKIDICIATNKRPYLLHKLLISLLNQECESKFVYTIIVSDNDSECSAEPIVKEFIKNGLNIIYDVEPVKNISLNRNRALSHATGDFIAILDDDQYVGNRWLLYLYNTIITYHADVAFGAVIPIFKEGTSTLIRKSNAYGIANCPDGFSGGMLYHTGNCCFRTELITDMKEPFDVQLGTQMSEDTKFFELLRQQGCKIVWSKQATCYEYISPSRTKISWLLRRHYKIGLALFQAYGEERGCEVIHLNRKIKRIHLFLKIMKEATFFPLFMTLSVINKKFISNAVTNLEYIAMDIGILFYLLNQTSNRPF